MNFTCKVMSGQPNTIIMRTNKKEMRTRQHTKQIRRISVLFFSISDDGVSVSSDTVVAPLPESKYATLKPVMKNVCTLNKFKYRYWNVYP